MDGREENLVSLIEIIKMPYIHQIEEFCFQLSLVGLPSEADQQRTIGKINVPQGSVPHHCVPEQAGQVFKKR